MRLRHLTRPPWGEKAATDVSIGADKSTAAFRLKVLHLYLRERRGSRTAEAFADSLGGPALFKDETAPVSGSLWVRGIEQFVRRAGETAFRDLDTFFLHAEIAAAWARLPSASEPNEIFRVLAEGDRLPGDNPFTLATFEGGTWKISAELPLGAPAPTRRWILEALASELRALALLVGYQASVSVEDEKPLATFLVKVRPLIQSRFASWSAFSIAALLAHVALPSTALAERVSPRLELGSLAVATLLFGLGYELLRRERRVRAQARAQGLRIAALEREALLRSERSQTALVPHEEPMIAGKYRLGQALGSGAAGAVWSAIRAADGKEVALKLIRTAVAHDVRATDRLRREAEALELVWHPHVVEVYESGLLQSGTAFLAMARLYGESLADRLAREGPLDPVEVRTLALQLTDALVAVHSAGVIHRDIKPTNLFLHHTEDGQVTLKLIDFGVAHIAWAETRITRSGMRIGTAGYAAPEQEEGAPVTAQADLYSVGITLLECLTGSPRLPEDLADCPNIPAPLRDIIQRLTRPTPNERFASARELKESLLALKVEPSDRISLPIVLPSRSESPSYPELDSPTLNVTVGSRH